MEWEPDGQSGAYQWRKYGEKVVSAKTQAIRRSYYRCVCHLTHAPCSAKKRVDRLSSAEPGDAPLSVLYINRHNHGEAPLDGLRRHGSQEMTSERFGLPGGTRSALSGGAADGGQQEMCVLGSLSAEDLAKAMYSDLMLHLSVIRSNADDQHTELAATCTGVDSREDLSQDLSLDEDRRLSHEAEVLLSALLETSSDVVEAHPQRSTLSGEPSAEHRQWSTLSEAPSAEPGRMQGIGRGGSMGAASSSDAFRPDSPQVAASTASLVPEPRADHAIYPAPCTDPLFFSAPPTDTTLLAQACAGPTLWMPHLTEDSCWNSPGPPLLDAPRLNLARPRMNAATEGSRWAESFGCSAVEDGAQAPGRGACGCAAEANRGPFAGVPEGPPCGLGRGAAAGVCDGTSLRTLRAQLEPQGSAHAGSIWY